MKKHSTCLLVSCGEPGSIDRLLDSRCACRLAIAVGNFVDLAFPAPTWEHFAKLRHRLGDYACPRRRPVRGLPHSVADTSAAHAPPLAIPKKSGGLRSRVVIAVDYGICVGDTHASFCPTRTAPIATPERRSVPFAIARVWSVAAPDAGSRTWVRLEDEPSSGRHPCPADSYVSECRVKVPGQQQDIYVLNRVELHMSYARSGAFEDVLGSAPVDAGSAYV